MARRNPGSGSDTGADSVTIDDDLLKQFRVEPGKRLVIADHDPGWTGRDAFGAVDVDERKQRAQAFLEAQRAELSAAQELLWADGRYALLVVLQALDAAGKDSTIKHVMSGVNPQGVRVTSFKQPSTAELQHDFLWRYHLAAPERGQIGIFNRSYYEEVLVVRVHPELLVGQRIPELPHGDHVWEQRFEDIGAFERHLGANGTRIVKLFLNVSPGEQKKRFLKRLDDPTKHWKFSAADLTERDRWADYTGAFEDAISATSKASAPWYVVPADHKWVTRAIVSAILVRTLAAMPLRFPPTSADDEAVIRTMREKLSEG